MLNTSILSINPQSGSHSSSSGDANRMSSSSRSYHKALPPLFLYMETGDWARATERAKRHPREVNAWASIRSKSESSHASAGAKISSAKRLALHHACFKLRSSVNSSTGSTYNNGADPFIEVCKFILLLLEMYPDGAGMRESRHGCLPLHLAAFASCTLPSDSSAPASPANSNAHSPSSAGSGTSSKGGISRPSAITQNLRSVSESTCETTQTTMTAAYDEEVISGKQKDYVQLSDVKQAANRENTRDGSSSTISSETAAAISATPVQPTCSVSMGNNILISEKREEWAVKVLNALLDAYPRGIRMDSEGGRLPLHTACAGRATPQVVSTLLTAYPAAARHRNKDGFLPLHLAAHWGISHPNVAVALLKAYPDATFGRNRWERTPLEEALCMAGENGRPHQAALVRSLRKHPSYWTRPAELFQTKTRRGGNQIVDTDETLPSNDDDTEDGGHGLLDSFSGGFVTKGRLTVFGNGKSGEVEVMPLTDLPTLIRNQNWDGVLARLDMNPEEAEQELVVTTRGGFTATKGFTPLHYACERRPPVQVVDAMLAACPRAVSTRSMPGGALPIHIACTWYAPVSVVNTLLVADRAGCKTQDELGNLPLHSSCFSGTAAEVVVSLLRAYPKASLVRNHQGSLPEEICRRLKHDNRRTILPMLTKAKEDVLAKREKKHRRNRSDGYLAEIKESPSESGANPQNGGRDSCLMWV